MSLEDLTVDELRAHAAKLESNSNLMTSLLTNPKTREMVQRALKTANPNLVIPEIDSRDSLREEIKAEREERLKLERSIQESAIRTRIEGNRAAIAKKYDLSEADIGEVEKLMIDPENPIPSYDAAARVYLASRTSALPSPATFNAPIFTMPESDVWGKGIGRPATLNRIAMDEAYKAWSDIVGGKVPGLKAA